MSNLSDLTGFSNAIITFSVDNLENRELVGRERGEDRRTYYIKATEKGNKKYREILSNQRRVIEAIFEHMSQDDQLKFSRNISELRELIQKYL